ncbi:dTDP-4-dehydrorhamnose 3,5-epimerase [Candidatus Saccharibacteria bacterium]|nr:dTDP-4-dehydrorhamnose 3,5-epimerase [Candidatus Saccharibacteria bacterium]MBQ9017034.1 dTDP-4-dehydrorhamnose 3,5-epimerase [Candidatus Saccharibacteria bacterium]
MESGNFRFEKTEIPGLVVITPKVFPDERGHFLETYSEKDFAAAGINCKFVQDNQSGSVFGVLRGLHFQKEHPQAKLVRATFGQVWDVAVDLREGSPTFGRWHGVLLSDKNKKQFFIPKGFAHGFVVLSGIAEFSYKCDDFYAPGDEGGLLWDDPEVGIKWPIEGFGGVVEDDESGNEFKGLRREDLILSEKDQGHPTLENCFRFKEKE